MSHLFDEFRIKAVTLRNRIGVSPMCQYSSEGGMMNDWHLVHLGSRAVGGAALVIAEATAVEYRGQISPNDVGLWNDDQIEPMIPITRFIKRWGAVPGIQLGHAGRKAGTPRRWNGVWGDWQQIAPSPIAFGGNASWIPQEMTRDDIQTVQHAFREATRRAVDAGYDWLELHGAHGYLVHSFHSPLSNHRTDAYGGSFENRIRFTIETVRLMREVWPENKPFTVRLSCTDWVEGGWTIEESVELSHILKREGIDLIDCSSGGAVIDAHYPVGSGFQVPFAERIRREAAIPTAAVGIITEPRQADQIIRLGQADLVLLGREMLRDPYWAIHAAHQLGQKKYLNYPDPYHWAVG
ncbi:MAG: NADH:flavin oxidoreductase/NADH oxidase [Gemmatimonadetes bacterium]|nr:MAG: NADH:flavin oxidoreductase/NADH oxidase [Gemmatimonadota bacterium]